ncbi:hypothetical protein D2N39_11665 [Gemmobacter lutimaris]|jgi:hypothetical protein|uniref:Uncharacterized protein n=2 Tax=Gemmobacter lutimaris TaxID=2306023 RepID=A0A398BXG4_9RHOB|nr:hypothetical protein D2N39_11665 [Gemmobacter lutimaris]
MVYEEAGICVERLDRDRASDAILMQAAITTAVAAFGKDGGKAAVKHFSSLVKQLSGEDDPGSSKIDMGDLVRKEKGRHGAQRR